MGHILKVELTGLADVLDVREGRAQDDSQFEHWEGLSLHFQNGQKRGENVLNGETRGLVLEFRSKVPFKHPRGDVKKVVVDKSLDFRTRS